MIAQFTRFLELWSRSWLYQRRDGDNRRNHGFRRELSGEVAKSRKLRIQSVNRVFALTLTFVRCARSHLFWLKMVVRRSRES